MKKVDIKLAVGCIGLVAFLAVIGWAGDMDYTEQVILRMSYEEYDTVKQKLYEIYGHEPSERDIAHWWAEHNRE